MREIIVFFLNGKEYGIEIIGMQSLEKIQEIRPLPDAPDYILGTVKIRDGIYPVFDINSKISTLAGPGGGQAVEYTKILLLRTKAGTGACLVDRVDKVLRAEGEDVQPFPKMAMTKDTDFVDFVVRRENRLIVVIKPNALLTEEQVKCIRELDFSKIEEEES